MGFKGLASFTANVNYNVRSEVQTLPEYNNLTLFCDLGMNFI